MDVSDSDPIELQFVKMEDSFDKYEVQFFNPLKKKWWTIPAGYCFLQGPWDLSRKGGYGAYDLEFMSCGRLEIDGIKSKFRTVGDIREYFSGLTKKYEEWKRSKEADDKLPKIIR
jgi:hypothetical protein